MLDKRKENLENARLIPATFGYDDFPVGKETLLDFIDAARDLLPDFKATIFAVPEWMSDADWVALDKRKAFIEVGMHGFAHARTTGRPPIPECEHPPLYKRKLRWLDELAMPGSPWTSRLFKAPWHGYGADFLERFVDHCAGGIGLCVDHLENFSFPFSPTLARTPVWARKDWLWRRGWLSMNDYHCRAHPPSVDAPDMPRARRSDLSERRRARWLKAWLDFDAKHWREHGCGQPWAFASQLTRPLLVKIMVGCGRRLLPGWLGLDKRPTRQGVQGWTWPAPLPVNENTADVILSSHFLNFLPAERYVEFFLDCWRALRPGGVLRLSEDRCESGRVWKHPGGSDPHGNVIQSTPTQAAIGEALTAVGFDWREVTQDFTSSPHRDVLLGNTRELLWHEGVKAYYEAVKAIEIPMLRRVQASDPRRAKNGTYRLPG